MSVAVVTDSTAYLPEDLRAAGAIGVVPLHVVIGGQELSEGVDVTPSQVAEALRAFTPVTTSRPSPAAFLEAYRQAADAGATAIVSVHISSAMSSTIAGAQLAAAEAPVPVAVVDSRALGMAMAYAAVAAARAGADGAPVAEVERIARETAVRSRVVFYVDTLEYLRRGGRIGAASALVGSALAIKPILTLTDGSITPLERVRTSAKAIARLEDLAVAAAGDLGGEVVVGVHHLDSLVRAEALAAALRTRLGLGEDLRIVELGAVVGAHVGPGTLAVSVSPRTV